MPKLLIFLSLLAIASCTDGLKKIEIVHPQGYYKEVYHVDKNNVRNGQYLKINNSEVLVDSCHYKEGEIHGVRRIWTDKGVLDIEETYNMGTLEGPYTTFYSDGQIKKEQQFVDNQIEGEVKQYYPGGRLKAIVQFSGSLENGPFKEFYENGNLQYEGFYQGGDQEQDTLRQYNTNGELIRKMYCTKGICQTVWTPEQGYIERKSILNQNVSDED